MTARRAWLLFLAFAAVGGCVFWRQADWWAYRVDTFTSERVPKFELPLWVQLPVSAVVGCFCGGAGLALTRLASWAWTRRTRRNT